MVTSRSRALAQPCPACAQHFGEGSARRLFLSFKHLRNTTCNKVSRHLGRKAEAGGSPQQRPAGAVPAVTAWTCRRAVGDFATRSSLVSGRAGAARPRATGAPVEKALLRQPVAQPRCPVLSRTESHPKSCQVPPFPLSL